MVNTGIKETLIVSGGDYVEDNPISLPPDCSVVGDNLRLVIIRPANLRKTYLSNLVIRTMLLV